MVACAARVPRTASARRRDQASAKRKPRSSIARSADEKAVALEQPQQLGDGLYHGQAVGAQHQLRALGRLVRVVDSREALHLTGTGFLVQALGIPLLRLVDRAIDVDLEKRKLGVLVQLANQIAVATVGTDEARQRDHGRVAE